MDDTTNNDAQATPASDDQGTEETTEETTEATDGGDENTGDKATA